MIQPANEFTTESRAGTRAGSKTTTGIRAGSGNRAGIRAGAEIRSGIRAGSESKTGIEDRVIDCEPPPYGGPAGRYYLLNRVYVAGFPYYLGPRALGQIRPGDRLHLAAEPSNPHDRYAVEVGYGPCKLGYIPRSDNRHISRLLRQGARLYCIAIEVNPDNPPWQALRIAIYLETDGGGDRTLSHPFEE